MKLTNELLNQQSNLRFFELLNQGTDNEINERRCNSMNVSYNGVPAVLFTLYCLLTAWVNTVAATRAVTSPHEVLGQHRVGGPLKVSWMYILIFDEGNPSKALALKLQPYTVINALLRRLLQAVTHFLRQNFILSLWYAKNFWGP